MDLNDNYPKRYVLQPLKFNNNRCMIQMTKNRQKFKSQSFSRQRGAPYRWKDLCAGQTDFSHHKPGNGL